MQSGLFFLWILFVGVSIAAWFYLEVSLAWEKGQPSRRRITGCELARQVLDRNRHHQTAVLPVSSGRRVHFGLDFNRLVLSEKIYYGMKLGDLATALHETAHLLIESKPSLPVEFWAKAVCFLRMTVLASWLLIAVGMFFSAFRWMVSLGEILFVALFFRALMSLGEEWEVTERAAANLTLLEGLGTDERVRMRKLLNAIRWARFAELFAEPFTFLFRNKGEVSIRVS